MTGRRSLTAGVILAGLLAFTTSAGASPFLIETDGVFLSYSGPVGAAINSGMPPYVDVGYGPSRFSNGGTVLAVSPEAPYNGYPWPQYADSGTATQDFTGGWESVEFSNQFIGGGGEAVNTLTITGTTTSDVTLGALFHIATISFTNGTWFSSEPLFDPGNGALYPVSEFSFVITASADPATGTEPHVWEDTLRLVSTRGVGTPDNLFLANHPQLGGMAIPEGATGSVEVWGKLGSLEPIELRNPTNASLIPAAVPEAPAFLNLLIGMGLLSSVRAWRGRRGGEST
jgi:hypothetical protein